MKLKTIAIAGALALSGLGLIGVGAHAQFTSSASSNQTITAGTPAVALWAGNSTNGCTSEAIAEEYPSICDSITLTPGTVGSSFDEASDIGIVNVGTIPVSLVSFSVTDTDGGGAAGANWWLQQNLAVCIQGVFDGYLPAAFSASPIAASGSLAVGGYTTYGVDLYAGGYPTYCGNLAAALPNGAVGGSDTVIITANVTG